MKKTLLLAVVLVSTACLPIPDAVIAFGCGTAFADSDDQGVAAHYEDLFPGYAAGLASPPEVLYANLLALSSAASSALGTKIAGVWVSTDLERAVIGVTDDLENMATVIEAIAPHPDDVVIADRRADAAVGDAVWARVETADLDGPGAGTPSLRFLRDGVSVHLPPTGAAAALATELRATHGDRLSIHVGTRRLGGGPEYDTGPCVTSLPRWVIGAGVPDNVVVQTVVDTPSVERGGRVEGRILVTNNGAAPVFVSNADTAWCVSADQPLTTTDRQFTVNGSTIGAPPGYNPVHDLAETYPLLFAGGGRSADWSPAPGSPGALTVVCPPDSWGGQVTTGQTQALHFVADTLSSRPEDDLLLPPGDYLVRPMVNINIRFGRDHGPIALPPAPVTIRE